MVVGSRYGLPGTLRCTTWEWQSMHSGTLACWACEKATGGAEPAGLAAGFGDATAEADGSVTGSRVRR